MKALIVHGSATGRTLFSAQLTCLGIEFETAATAAEALQRLEHDTFAVVLLAWDLDETGTGGGLELLRQIRTEERWTALPVLLITSVEDVMRLEQAYDAYASEFLVQPSDEEQLLEKLLVLGLDPEPVREMRAVPRPRPALDPAAPTAARSPEDPEARRAA
jgi:two-component system chemotaxis response regulator CheY